MSDEAREALLESLVIWTWKDHTQGQDVVDAACTALVAGLDSPALRDLAGLYPDTPHEVLRTVVDHVVAELGLALPDGDDALNLYVLRAQARKVIDGGMTPRALTEWAFSHRGAHDSDEHERFVGVLWEYEELDDTQEPCGNGAPTHAEEAALDARVRRMARALLKEAA